MDVYIDACIAIYLVEEHAEYAARIEDRLRGSTVRIAYSPLVKMECLVLPMRQKRMELIERFHDFFALNQPLSITDAVFGRATELRARHGLKTPDALHLATAQHYGCTALWTNDDRLNKVAGSLAVNVLAL